MSDRRVNNRASTHPTLRLAEMSDLDELTLLERELFGRDAWSKTTLESEVAGPHRAYFVFTSREGRIIGYGGVLVVGGDADIQTLAIAPQSRGLGLGRRLLHALLDEARERGARQVFLEVRADNPIALGLYTQNGFEQIGRRERYYQPDGIDAIIMRAIVNRDAGQEGAA